MKYNNPLVLQPRCGKGKPFRRSACLLLGLLEVLFLPLPPGKRGRSRSGKNPSDSASCLGEWSNAGLVEKCKSRVRYSPRALPGPRHFQPGPLWLLRMSSGLRACSGAFSARITGAFQEGIFLPPVTLVLLGFRSRIGIFSYLKIILKFSLVLVLIRQTEQFRKLRSEKSIT